VAFYNGEATRPAATVSENIAVPVQRDNNEFVTGYIIDDEREPGSECIREVHYSLGVAEAAAAS
jgi:hypothetical protein